MILQHDNVETHKPDTTARTNFLSKCTSNSYHSPNNRIDKRETPPSPRDRTPGGAEAEPELQRAVQGTLHRSRSREDRGKWTDLRAKLESQFTFTADNAT